jgi:phosphohistidine phosphatase
VKRLLLLRHAKAVPGDDKTEDHERSLNARGRADASLIGAEMHHRLYVPDLALSSTSKRTVETWERLAPEFDRPPNVEFLPSLYHASPKSLLKIVQSADDGADTLLVLGHNPGLEEFAIALTRSPQSKTERALLDKMHEKFPTCALAVFDFDAVHWQDIRPETGALADFLRPKDLKGE